MAVVITGNNTPTAGGVTYGDGTTYVNTAAGTAGQPLVSGGSGAPAFRPYTLPAADGTANQVLQTNGAGALSFATPSAGALVFISSQTVSTAVASVDFTSGISSTYDDYQIIFENFTSSSSSAFLQYFLRQSGAFGTNYSTVTTVALDGSINTYVSASQSFIGQNAGGSPTTATSWMGSFILSSANSATARRPAIVGNASALGTAVSQNLLTSFTGASNTAAVVTGFRLAYSTGNIATGTVRLYGIAKA